MSELAVYRDGSFHPVGFPVTQVWPRAIELLEPLQTLAPCPDKTQPHCCYWKTVIFYVRPYIVRPWHRMWRSPSGRLLADKPGSSFEEWDRIETELFWDLPLRFQGQTFLCGGGRVEWHQRRWWMRRTAWKK